MGKKISCLVTGISHATELWHWGGLKAITYLEAWRWEQCEDPCGLCDERFVFEHHSGWRLTIMIGAHDMHNESRMIVYDGWLMRYDRPLPRMVSLYS